MDETYTLGLAWNTPGLQGQLILIIFLGVLTLALAYFNYQHLLPKSVAFFLSSAIPTSIIAYLSVVIVMGRIPVDLITIVSGLILFLIVDITFRIYRKSITSPKYVENTLKKQQKIRNRKIGVIKRKIKAVTKK